MNASLILYDIHDFWYATAVTPQDFAAILSSILISLLLAIFYKWEFVKFSVPLGLIARFKLLTKLNVVQNY